MNVSTPPAEGPWCEFQGCGLPASRYAELGALAAAIVDEESKRENPDRSLGLLNLAHFTITRSIQLGAARGEL